MGRDLCTTVSRFTKEMIERVKKKRFEAKKYEKRKQPTDIT
jgi:hypothetical protein